MSLLDVRDLHIYFGSASNAVEVVSGLNFSIGESEIFGLAGESGCGKSITALSIMGILPRSAFAKGQIFFDGRDLLKLDEESKRHLRGNKMSMVFQEPMTSLNPVLTIGYQIAEVLVTHRGMSMKDASDRAIELLRSVKIPSPEVRIKEYPHQMSGGMRQRVMIAMAIACNPSLLIADEPTTALDVTIQAQILELVQNLREEHKMSILFITHDLGIIAENASRVAIMYAGKLVELAQTSEMFSNPRHPYTIGLLESIPKGKGIPLKPISGNVPGPEDFPKGCRYIDRCSMKTGSCRGEETPFIEVSEGHFVRCGLT
ncbi:dipeptide transporter; ATP-binding component of ABC superfamily [Candidatus Sulfobium mesophilum]|uniref:Dipeptide transporter ATP-binding component of ABC superfamily n=1 Tax=Candidatus Sulfobium mesophilum TaxID=2016548 RepID=A0A2U3QL29_9BACT|nr:dipeptide transporter; ATP-binding component of ABC superfamily [Candidatus Sulfobium mesophilum]